MATAVRLCRFTPRLRCHRCCWQALRQASYQEALTQLQTLPGIGPKVRQSTPSAAKWTAALLRCCSGSQLHGACLQVAACIALFSLDKSEAIPVDTHVWQLATRYYCPHLAEKTLTPRVRLPQPAPAAQPRHCSAQHRHEAL